jgi:hypothetical protein
MKMLNDRMLACIEYSLPSGEYVILSTTCHPSHVTFEGPFKVPLRSTTYCIKTECWDRRTGASFLYELSISYRRYGLVRGGDWLCSTCVADIRHPSTKSGYGSRGQGVTPNLKNRGVSLLRIVNAQ